MSAKKIRKRAILVVEDHPDLVRIYKKKLEIEGFSVFSADSVSGAKKVLETKTIDAIWLDHYLPGELGTELVRYLSDHEEWRNISVVVISNTSSESRREEYLQLGVSKFLVKAEHSVEELTDEFKKLLEKN